MSIHSETIGSARLFYARNTVARNADMPHKIAVAFSLQLPDSDRIQTDTVWVAPIGDDDPAKIDARGYSAYLSFLSAAAEAYRYGMGGQLSENATLFPEDVMEWAYVNSEEIEMALLETEEHEDWE